MNVTMNVDDTGFKQVCEATMSRVSRGTKIAAQEAGQAVLAMAQARCPHYTNTLRNSGAVKIEGSSKNNYSPGFSAIVSFGNGDKVNPITGQHPSEYAAAVHESFAANPITGELSSYRSGEPKFLENSVKEFEALGLYKVAYSHWGNALQLFMNDKAMIRADKEAEAMMRRDASPAVYTNKHTLGEDGKLRMVGGGYRETDKEVIAYLAKENNMRSSLFGEYSQSDSKEFKSYQDLQGAKLRAATRIAMGAKSGVGLTNWSLYRYYARNAKLINAAVLYCDIAATGITCKFDQDYVSSASAEVIALAEALRNFGVTRTGKVAEGKDLLSPLTQWQNMVIDDYMNGDEF